MPFLKFLRIKIHSTFRFCLNCGSWRARDSLLCGACEQLLVLPALESKSDVIDGLKSVYCFDWIPDENRLLSLVLTELKGCLCTKTYAFYGQWIALKMRTLEKRRWIIVPCPSSSKGRLHSQKLAEAVAALTGIPVMDILSLKPREEAQLSSRQKDLGKQERSKIKMMCQSSEAIQDVIFIDDVITTGATARAAYLALGNPRNFIVHTLSRRRLAGARLIC